MSTVKLWAGKSVICEQRECEDYVRVMFTIFESWGIINVGKACVGKNSNEGQSGISMGPDFYDKQKIAKKNFPLK